MIRKVLILTALFTLNALAENRIVNPSAEIIKDGKPYAWDKLKINLKGNFHLVGDARTSGKHSLILDCADEKLSVKNYLAWRQDGLHTRLKDCPPGTVMEFSVNVNTFGNPNVKYRFYVEMKKGNKYIGTFLSGIQTNYVGWQKKTFRFTMPKEVPTHAYVCLQLLTPGKIAFDDISLIKIGMEEKTASKTAKKPFAALSDAEYGLCRVTDFPPRQTWYGNPPSKLTMNFILPQDAGKKVKVTLKDQQGKDILTKIYSDVSTAVLELPKLNPGAYVIHYDAGNYHNDEFFRVTTVADKNKGIYFDSEHRIYYKGKPFFPLILICHAGNYDEDSFRIYKDLGFNGIVFPFLLNDSAVAERVGKLLKKYDLFSFMMSTSIGNAENDPDQGGSISRKMAHFYKNSKLIPGFLGYCEDELDMRQIHPNGSRNAYREVFCNQPDLLVWQNHAPRMTGTSGLKYGNFDNIKRFTAAGDVTGVDIYPVPEGNFHSELKNKTLSCVGDFTDLAYKSGYNQKPVWMILQAGSWPEWNHQKATQKQPRPTYEQTRFMLYNAITHGARGIAMSGRGLLNEVYTPEFARFADVYRELTFITSYIIDGRSVALKKSALPSCIRAEVWQKKSGEAVAILVNESKQNVTLDSPFGSVKNNWFELPAGTAWNKAKITLSPHGVLLLSTNQKVIPKTPVYTKKIKNSQIDYYPWKSHWTSHPKIQNAGETVYAKQAFTISSIPEKAYLVVAADYQFTAKINGKELGSGQLHPYAFRFDIAPYLKKGVNMLKFVLKNSGFPGLVFWAQIGDQVVLSGKNTLYSADGKTNWLQAQVAGIPPCAPWGKIIVLDYKIK